MALQENFHRVFIGGGLLGVGLRGIVDSAFENDWGIDDVENLVFAVVGYLLATLNTEATQQQKNKK